MNNPQARLLFIGDHWTQEDVFADRPFSGKSGAFLRGVVKKAGLESITDFTYVSLEQPVGDKLTKEERAAALDTFYDRLRGWKSAEIVVPIGREAIKAFNLKGKVLAISGIRRDYALGERTLGVIPIASPGYVLRQRAYATTWQGHFHNIRTALQRGDADWFTSLGVVHLGQWPSEI
jgi:uracil-DNA glycosylase family 4